MCLCVSHARNTHVSISVVPVHAYVYQHAYVFKSVQGVLPTCPRVQRVCMCVCGAYAGVYVCGWCLSF